MGTLSLSNVCRVACFVLANSDCHTELVEVELVEVELLEVELLEVELLEVELLEA